MQRSCHRALLSLWVWLEWMHAPNTLMVVSAFTASSSALRSTTTTTITTTRTRTAMSMAPLSNEEVFARAQQQQKEAQQLSAKDEPPPMLFDEDMLSDMQAALLLLERRVQNGPGSLTVLEIEQLDAQISKIVREMKENEHTKPPRPTRTQEDPVANAVNVPTKAPSPARTASPPTLPLDTPKKSSPKVTASPPPRVPAAAPPKVAVAPPAPAAPAATGGVKTKTGDGPVETIGAAPKVIDIDTPSDEGEEYSGTGGMGQAADTVNTYIIPGMDEMSPEEYQAALQKSVSDRQSDRKAGTGATGNRSSWDYLNSLTGESGVLKKQEKEEEQEEKSKGENKE